MHDGVEESAELPHLERPLDRRRWIDLPIDHAVLEHLIQPEVAGELDLAGGTGGEEIHVARRADQVIGTVVEKPTHAHFVGGALRALLLREARLRGDTPHQRDGESQSGGASPHPRTSSGEVTAASSA